MGIGRPFLRIDTNAGDGTIAPSKARMLRWQQRVGRSLKSIRRPASDLAPENSFEPPMTRVG
jgi:hypothetical protein